MQKEGKYSGSKSPNVFSWTQGYTATHKLSEVTTHKLSEVRFIFFAKCVNITKKSGYCFESSPLLKENTLCIKTCKSNSKMPIF